MATSRYGNVDIPAGNVDNTKVITTQPAGPTTTTSNQTQTGRTNTSGSQNTQAQSTTANMDPKSMAALQMLIQQLLGGGTQSQAQDRANRMQEISAVQGLRGDYSKNAAFADAQGAMNQILRQAMEQAMPTLVRAAEGAGTSANSMRALLTQDALTRASEAAAARGLQAATDYGTVGANYSSVLERLTQPNNSVEEALLNALNVAKGAWSQTNETSNTQTRGTQNSSTNTKNVTVQQNPGNTVTQTEQFATPQAGGTRLGGFSAQNSGMANLSNAQWAALAQATRSPGTAQPANWYQQYLI